MKYAKELREHFGKRAIFTSRDVALHFSQKKLGGAYRNLLLHNLMRRGEIRQVKKGSYTFGDDIACVAFAYSPSYYGLQDALSIHGLWEQETNPVVLTSRRVRQGLRQFEGRNYLVRRISRKMFFGFAQMKHGGMFIPVSDIEKTLIDFFHFRERLGPEALGEIKKRMDRKKLDGYLKKCPRKLRITVMGALACPEAMRKTV